VRGESIAATLVNGGAMQTAQVVVDNHEQVARDIGKRWAERLKAVYSTRGQAITSWPGTLEEARRLVDVNFGQQLPDEERELSAMLVERGARREWHTSGHYAIAVGE
jgi:hypothetical protein